MARRRDIDDHQRALVVRYAEFARNAAQQAERSAFAATLRSFYYDKQGAFFQSRAKRRATRKTRRSGATTGGCRELLARAVESARFRATYVTSTRIEAKERAWESDTQSGFVDLLAQYGKLLDKGNTTVYALPGGIEVEVREQELALEFSNGSRINLFGADDERSLRKQRGLAKHVYWIDEAQDFRFLLQFYKAVIVGALVDYDGECWLTGTPSRDCSGLFYEVTRDDPTDEFRGWEVHSIAVVDNPFFGATEAERWERTAGAAIRDNGWQPDDPDLLREWFARWVLIDANYVYAANAVPDHTLCFAPMRLRGDGYPDVKAAMLDLPLYGRRDYFLALGADLGWKDPFAWVIWAWSLLDPVLYEVASWKQSELDYDQQAEILRALRAELPIGLVTADAGGGGKPAVQGWSKKWVERHGVPIIEATKTNKHVSIEQLNGDIRRGLVKCRTGSPLVLEWRTHKWLSVRSATGTLVEGRTDNHCSDAGLYAYRESYHFRGRVPAPPPDPGSVEWALREEREIEQALDSAEAPDWWS